MVTRSTNVHEGRWSESSRACDNPDCTERVQWSGQRGRPALFCSSACRKRAINTASRLDAALQDVERDLDVAALTYRELRAAGAEASRLRWLLSAYPESTRAATAGTSGDL